VVSHRLPLTRFVWAAAASVDTVMAVVAQLIEVSGLRVGQAVGFAGNRCQERPELQAPLGLRGFFQDVTHLGLGAASVLGCASPQGSMHIFRNLPDREDGHGSNSLPGIHGLHFA
jgi:hypothetical protein